MVAEDCHTCGDSGDYGTWQCQKPANANPADHGACGPPAADCAELGQSVTVLPAPWSQASPGCSGDPDCSAAEIQYDVGTMIHGILGGSELDLGTTTLHICTAAENASGAWAYPLDECALVPIAEAVDCGVCAPCSTDADCAPISIDTLVPGLFCDDPQALLGGAVLIDLLWGDNPEHELRFFCQSVAGDAGVCTPCGNPTQRCTEGGRWRNRRRWWRCRSWWHRRLRHRRHSRGGLGHRRLGRRRRCDWRLRRERSGESARRGR